MELLIARTMGKVHSTAVELGVPDSSFQIKIHADAIGWL